MVFPCHSKGMDSSESFFGAFFRIDEGKDEPFAVGKYTLRKGGDLPSPELM